MTAPTNEQIGRVLERRRDELGLSLQETHARLVAAGATFKSHVTVHNIEIGARRLRATDLWLFAGALETTPGELLRQFSRQAERVQRPHAAGLPGWEVHRG